MENPLWINVARIVHAACERLLRDAVSTGRHRITRTSARGHFRSFNDRARQLIIVRSISLANYKISVKPLELGMEIEELL
jgi:hypothetical protein